MAEGNSNDYKVMELSEAVKLISEKAQDVYINKKNVKNLAACVMKFVMEDLKKFYMYNNNFVRPLAYLYDYKDSRKADWLFVLHTLNFSLWYPKGTKQWKVGNAKGYYGLSNAVRRATDEKIPIWDPKYYVKITRIELEHIFRSDDETCIPLIDERVRILHEVGEVLLNKYQGTFMECIKSSDCDADNLMKLLFDEFESYRDQVIYDGKKVRFLIKARSLVGDIWDYFKEKPKFNLNTKKMMSIMFIDYCSPQLLFAFKILRYSDVLLKRFENGNEPLEYGSREEIEIRGCSLFVAKEVCKEVHRLSQRHKEEKRILKTKAFNVSIVVDNCLANHLFFKNEQLKQHPLHYIRTVYY